MLVSFFEKGVYSPPLRRDVSWDRLSRRLTEFPLFTPSAWSCPTCDGPHARRRWAPGRCRACGAGLVPCKRAVPAWSPWTFDDGRRTADNARRCELLVIEYDGTAGSVDDISGRWMDFTHIVYTTWSHADPQAARARVVVPLERPITAAEWPAVWASVTDPDIDRQCPDAGRLWFLPFARPLFAARHHTARTRYPVHASPPAETREPSRGPVAAPGDPPMPIINADDLERLRNGHFVHGAIHWIKAYREATHAPLNEACRALAAAVGGPVASSSAPSVARNQAPDVAHTCHVPGCKRAVPPRMLMCAPHWRSVPKAQQDAVWAHYRPGQEVDKRPSPAWFAAAKDAIAAAQAGTGPGGGRDARAHRFPISDRYKSDPSARAALGAQIGKVVGNRVVEVPCPKCRRPSVWWLIQPDGWPGAKCNHERSCDWRGWLDQVALANGVRG